MNILDHISESLETIFWFKILKFFDAVADPDPRSRTPFHLDPGWKKLGSGIRDKHPGSATQPAYRDKAIDQLFIFVAALICLKQNSHYLE